MNNRYSVVGSKEKGFSIRDTAEEFSDYDTLSHNYNYANSLREEKNQNHSYGILEDRYTVWTESRTSWHSYMIVDGCNGWQSVTTMECEGSADRDFLVDLAKIMNEGYNRVRPTFA